MRIKVHWDTKDGSFGSRFPQTTEFYVDDDEWEGMNEDEKYEFAYEEVYEDFVSKVYPGFKMSDIEVLKDE